MKMNTCCLLSALTGFTVSAALAQIGDTRPSSATTTIGESKVTITVTGGERVIAANGLPNHATGRFPNRGNPNAITEKNYRFYVPTNPKAAEKPSSASIAWFGVALNGVPFEPGTAEFWNENQNWNYEAMGGTINLGLDRNNAHVQPNGAYHYHGLPGGLMEKLGGDGNKMLLIGYAADGFPIYTSYGYSVARDAKSPLKKMRSRYRLKHGEHPSEPNGPGGKYDGQFTADYEYAKGSGDLDECNGYFGVTPEYPQGIYHYYITEEFPFVSRFWRGTPDESFKKPWPRPGSRARGPGAARPEGRDERPGGPPPPR
jgi:hypothetical protein